MSENKEIIPVFFSTSDKYAPYLGVALYSLCQHASEKYKYKIYILYSEISERYKSELIQLESNNIKIQFINISKLIKKHQILENAHFTLEAVYRLLVDKVFSQYSKIVYLDCDIVINKDIADLFHENIDNVILGACLARIYGWLYGYLKNEIRFPLSKYFNAGVLLINIPLFTKYEIGKKGLKMLEHRVYSLMDQDVLNILCEDQVKYIDGRWNVEWGHIAENCEAYIDKYRKGSLDYIETPYIMHYTTGLKPWEHPEIELAKIFWIYAKKSRFYREIIKINSQKFDRYVFPWEYVKPDSKIILYGGGNVGKSYINQIERILYCTILAVCDTYPNSVKDIILPIIAPEKINEFLYDSIVIAIEDETVAMSILTDLKHRGVKEQLIIWNNHL